jgi:hypothetical protein
MPRSIPPRANLSDGTTADGPDVTATGRSGILPPLTHPLCPETRVMPSADLLSETKACDLLARVFRARGYDVVRNIPFREYGVSFHIDGWDAKARVGFEFLSSEDEDHDDLTVGEYQTLMAAQLRGELAVFIIDEVEPLSASDLRGAAEEFLEEVAAAVRARRKPARKPAPARKATKATGKGGAKPAAKAAKKPVAPVAKKPAAKKAKPKAGKTAGKAAAKPVPMAAAGKRVATKQRGRGR